MTTPRESLELLSTCDDDGIPRLFFIEPGAGEERPVHWTPSARGLQEIVAILDEALTEAAAAPHREGTHLAGVYASLQEVTAQYLEVLRKADVQALEAAAMRVDLQEGRDELAAAIAAYDQAQDGAKGEKPATGPESARNGRFGPPG